MHRATENPRPLSGTNMGTFCQIKVVSDSLQLDVSKSPSKNRKIESQKITVFSLYLRHLSADPQLLRGKKMLPGMPDHSAFYAQGPNLMPGAQKWCPKSINPSKNHPHFLHRKRQKFLLAPYFIEIYLKLAPETVFSAKFFARSCEIDNTCREKVTSFGNSACGPWLALKD